MMFLHFSYLSSRFEDENVLISMLLALVIEIISCVISGLVYFLSIQIIISANNETVIYIDIKLYLNRRMVKTHYIVNCFPSYTSHNCRSTKVLIDGCGSGIWFRDVDI